MQQQPDTAVTKWIVILAWIAGFGLVTFVFAELLESQFNPNRIPSSSMVGSRVEVVLEQNRQGHYISSGTINGVPVVFLIDTGATDVAIPAHMGEVLGLTPGHQAYAQTANGIVTVAETMIDEISLGEITMKNVAANLNPGMREQKILLGMSFLRHVEFLQKDKTLILRTL